MRLSTSAIVLGAASSAMGLDGQKVLTDASSKAGIHLDAVEAWIKPLTDSFGQMTSEAKATWRELFMLAPDAVEAFKAQLIDFRPKSHSRIPDSKWDHVVRGADVQGLWVEGQDGEKHRKVGGKLDNFGLRVKKVNPSKLGVDKVKQYSGYLDDHDKDKHLFYCETPPFRRQDQADND